MGTIVYVKAEHWRRIIEIAQSEYTYDAWVEIKKAVKSSEYHYGDGDWDKESKKAKEDRIYTLYLVTAGCGEARVDINTMEEAAAVAWATFEKSSLLTKSALLEKVYALCEIKEKAPMPSCLFPSDKGGK